MASTEQDLRRELHDEREQLAEGALALGFVASGGARATARLLRRRGRARD
jgi:hypothetical protein